MSEPRDQPVWFWFQVFWPGHKLGALAQPLALTSGLGPGWQAPMVRARQSSPILVENSGDPLRFFTVTATSFVSIP